MSRPNFEVSEKNLQLVAKLLGCNFNYLITTQIDDSNDLEILPQVDKIRTEEVDRRISDMLDRIEKIRLVHEQSRARHRKEEDLRDDPSAVVVLSPVPEGMSDEDLAATFSVHGRVRRIDRDGGQAFVQLGLRAQAEAAVAALRSSNAFGDHVRMWTRGEEAETLQSDSWSREWSRGPAQGDAGLAAPGGKGKAVPHKGKGKGAAAAW
ncbi:unnamed protein product [Prorocentrum cordatum]|uniref:RRM domain-containing protein n=1 Tax=Prorocentrum cordatum TaxID=2364126 RepID=A0ABN9WTM0_9DINO|nr:unnamed protein product [Polarella glacialis]